MVIRTSKLYACVIGAFAGWMAYDLWLTRHEPPSLLTVFVLLALCWNLWVLYNMASRGLKERKRVAREARLERRARQRLEREG